MNKETYYKTCPECNANLDPQEFCDCEKAMEEAAQAVLSIASPEDLRTMLDNLRTRSLLANIEVRKARTLLASLFEANRLDGIGDDIELPLSVVQECLEKAVAAYAGTTV